MQSGSIILAIYAIRQYYPPVSMLPGSMRGERFGGADGNGGGSGGRDSRRNDSYDGGNRGSGDNAGRTTSRSSDWKMRGASSAYGQPGRGGPQHYGSSSGNGGGGGGGNGGGFGGARGYLGGGGRGGRGAGGFGAGRGWIPLLSGSKKLGRTSSSAAQFLFTLMETVSFFLVIS
jgi:hypothetical protein